DDFGGACARHSQTLPVMAARPVADTGDERQGVHEHSLRVPNSDQHLAGVRRDLRSTSCTRESGVRLVPAARDQRGIDVAVAVQLSRAEETDVTAPGLQPVVEYLR